jgi:CheY-like chemotaxis protein
MPVMDGYTATRELRKQEKFTDLPVIAMTANVMAGDREEAKAAGMNDHIAKPINVHEMLTTMAKWIKPGNVQNDENERAEIIAPLALQRLPHKLPGFD